MPTFKEFLGIRPKVEAKKEPEPMEETARKAREEARRAKLEEAKKNFVIEKPRLEQRLAEIPAKIKELEERLVAMKGPEMRRILDREFELNSAMSPDSTDKSPRGVREFESWRESINISKGGTREIKANLGTRIDDYQRRISVLEKEKREAEQRIQRGY
jgi:chaperonin cofactor prefoldin